MSEWKPEAYLEVYAPDGQRLIRSELTTVDGEWVKHVIYLKRGDGELRVDRDPPEVIANPPILPGDLKESPKKVCKFYPNHCPLNNVQCGWPDCAE